MQKITDAAVVDTMVGTHSILGNFGGAIGQISLDNFRRSLNENDEEVLNNFAFYIDVNKASAKGSAYVDVGGNAGMRELWENSAVSVLMDSAGNYCELNRNDNSYTADGEYVLDADGAVLSKWAHCDFMKIIPVTYARVQTVTVGTSTVLRLWLSLVPLPGGYTIPQLVVGKFKASVVGGALRSLPAQTPANTKTINAFWDTAQVRSKNHGLANLDFRNALLYHMMAKYGYRDAQNCKGSDSTPVWGVGLDGTESTLADGQADKFAVQKNIATGACLTLGDYDGNIGVADLNGDTCHSVNVWGFENPWGQYWEMVQGLCSVGDADVYHWRANWLPTGTPTAESFAGVEYTLLTRATSEGSTKTGMNIIAAANGQGVYMIPKEALSGVSYGDYFWYNASGQLWLFGGSSTYGSRCGLAAAFSSHVWSASYSGISARLAFYGNVNKVSSTRLAETA